MQVLRVFGLRKDKPAFGRQGWLAGWPRRVPMVKPSSGEKLIVVATERPW